jgi:hypothetical protein
MAKKAKPERIKRTRKQKLKGKKLTLTTIKVHPHFARAIASLERFAPEEIEEIKKSAGADFAEGAQATGCWLSDSGGQQHCVNLPPDVCARKGGISVPTKCPMT